ncbi:hypothetical protein ACFONG_06195 [Uliginosibacterium paludis]|uniref:Uncharacterized protein n=1 Tax=Uliginosibacterium paludis TaxID=1615952 RepID=A0ABV2CLL7_9RHOO
MANIRTNALFNAATLANIEEAGSSILILTEGLEREEFLRSRLTRGEAVRLLQLMADSIGQLPASLHEAMPELGFDGWRSTAKQLAGAREAADEALWFAVLSLVPATLMWLRTYRHNQPELFVFATP